MSPNPVKSSTHLFFLLLIAMCAVFVTWSYYGTLDVVSMAEGEVVPSGRVKQVQHFEGGIIQEIKVKEGDEVNAGQPLVELERIRSVASHEEIKMRIDALQVDVIRLKAQAEEKEQLTFSKQMEEEFPRLTAEARELFQARRQSHQSTMNKLETMIRQKEQRIITIEAQLQNKLERLPLIEEEKTLSEELLKDNLTTRIKHIDILKRLKETEGKIANDRSSLKEARHALVETREKYNEARNQFRQETAEQLKEIHQDLNEFSVRLKKFKDSLERTIIRSPIHGVVKKMYRVTRGGVLKPGDILADIVPLEERLVIEAHLAISDIGYIRKGQKTYLQLPTKDSKKFKKLEGTVINISPDTFTDPQGRTFYNVRIESAQSYFEAGSQKYRLYPGMVLIAYIHIGNRTILDYLIDPFVNTLSFSMQER